MIRTIKEENRILRMVIVTSSLFYFEWSRKSSLEVSSKLGLEVVKNPSGSMNILVEVPEYADILRTRRTWLPQRTKRVFVWLKSMGRLRGM